eukprot:scaffold2544_cov269-Chaetoceros_neogracile.AAC.3
MISPATSPIRIFLIILSIHASPIFASSRGPPPPPPPPSSSSVARGDRYHEYSPDGDRGRNRRRDRDRDHDYSQRDRYDIGKERRDNDYNNNRRYTNTNNGRRDDGRSDDNNTSRSNIPPSYSSRYREGYQDYNERNSPSNAETYNHEDAEREASIDDTHLDRDDESRGGRKDNMNRRTSMDPSRRQAGNNDKQGTGFSLFKKKQASTDMFQAKDSSPRKNESRDDNDTGITEKKTYNPIDYNFPSRSSKSSSLNGNEGSDEDLPQTGEEPNDAEQEQLHDKDRRRPMPKYTSARQDAIAKFSSTKLGKIQLGMASFGVGGTVGGFVGQSLLNHGKTTGLVVGFIFLLMSCLRNDYGEMSRSLGLGLIFLMRRSKAVRRRYRTGVHVRGMCRMGSRRPFPPVLEGEVENPWNYAPQSRDDPDFEMIKALLCMVLIGSFCGGNVPLIPTWMGSAGGAAAFAVFGIAKNARGDLIRTMGMRVVALVGEALRINSDLDVPRKVARVAGRTFDKLMILDRKHRIKDRIVQGGTWAYARVSNSAARVKKDMDEGKERGMGRGDESDDGYRRERDDDRHRGPPPTRD